jgi:hypothetical protein
VLVKTAPETQFVDMPTSEPQRLFELLNTPELPALGPGPRVPVEPRAGLEANLQSIFRTSKLAPDRQELIRALILLWHDHHEAAHTIVQDIENADGAFIHGIVHRREPDYSNSKYWFRRVGKHPAFAAMAKRAGELLGSGQSGIGKQIVPGGTWDAIGFINACERASETGAGDPELALREIQKIETECLLEYLCS